MLMAVQEPYVLMVQPDDITINSRKLDEPLANRKSKAQDNEYISNFKEGGISCRKILNNELFLLLFSPLK